MPSNRRAFAADDHVSSRFVPAETQSHRIADSPIVFTLDVAGNFRFVNQAAELLCGYTRQELCQMNIRDIIGPSSCNYLRQQLRRNIRQRFGTVHEVEVLTKNGQRVTLEASMHLVRDRTRALEIHGIALRSKRDCARFTPRCLDEQFVFNASVTLTC
jgi:PAS domain S-box-containing protein